MTTDNIAPLFTAPDGTYRFARWGRPMAPIVFGVDDATLATVKGAFQAVATLTGRELAETDPELGSNAMVFFMRDWKELLEVPDLDRLIDGLSDTVARLEAGNANQFRTFRFDKNGAIQACFLFLRMDDDMADIPAQDLALAQVVQLALLWSDEAFRSRSPLARLENGQIVLRPDIAGVLRAAYDPVMPDVAADPSHALRLSARVAMAQAQTPQS